MWPTHPVAQTPKLSIEEFMVPAHDPGVELYVRNKRPPACARSSRRAPSCSYMAQPIPRIPCFDFALDGLSWMDYIAARGYDVYLLDLRGYGKSTRPTELAEKPDANGSGRAHRNGRRGHRRGGRISFSDGATFRG